MAHLMITATSKTGASRGCQIPVSRRAFSSSKSCFYEAKENVPRTFKQYKTQGNASNLVQSHFGSPHSFELESGIAPLVPPLVPCSGDPTGICNWRIMGFLYDFGWIGRQKMSADPASRGAALKAVMKSRTNSLKRTRHSKAQDAQIRHGDVCCCGLAVCRQRRGGQGQKRTDDPAG